MNLKKMKFENIDSNIERMKKRISFDPQKNEQTILNYLYAGRKTIKPFPYKLDIFQNSIESIKKVAPNIICAYSTYSDNEWMWTDALIYYIEKYHFKVSKKFEKHVLNQVKKSIKPTEIDMEWI